jgi:hypothetical protein
MSGSGATLLGQVALVTRKSAYDICPTRPPTIDSLGPWGADMPHSLPVANNGGKERIP